MNRHRWLVVWLLQACTSSHPQSLPSDEPGEVELDAGAALQRALDASDAMSAARERDGDTDGGTPGLPMPADPCSTDLSFVGGTVQPSIGPTSSLDAASFELEKPGRFGVFERDLAIPLHAESRSAVGYQISITAGELDGTVYGPSDDHGASLASGRYPLLIAAPGFQAGYKDYAGFFRHFASYGFVVLGIQTRGSDTVPVHDKEALEATQALTFMLEASPYRDRLDAEKVAAVGHSKGGKVSFFAAALDARIDMVIGWDPSNAGGPPCGPIAALTGSDCNLFPVAPNCLAGDPGILQFMHAETLVFGVPPDELTNPTPEHNSINFYRGAPSPASLVYLRGGHTDWIENGFLGLLANPGIIRITKAVQTAKMLTVFYGATGLERYLPGGSYLRSQDPIVLQVASK